MAKLRLLHLWTKLMNTWYLPTFGVYHPKKPDQIQVVLDSSAECDGTSLKKVLLSIPDLNNILLEVLLRFWREPVAITADVQQMFYCFVICKDHRDLRYLWYEDNDINKNVAEYRMNVHVFGKSPSPAAAFYCMRQAAQNSEQEHGSSLLRDSFLLTMVSLQSPHLKMEAFPVQDHAKDLKDLDLGVDSLPLQRSLGLFGNLGTALLTWCLTKRSLLHGEVCCQQSTDDPLGFVAPRALI